MAGVTEEEQLYRMQEGEVAPSQTLSHFPLLGLSFFSCKAQVWPDLSKSLKSSLTQEGSLGG